MSIAILRLHDLSRVNASRIHERYIVGFANGDIGVCIDKSEIDSLTTAIRPTVIFDLLQPHSVD
jgi:hypothetical protein